MNHVQHSIEAVAGEAYGWFTTTERGEDTITVLKDGAPEWVTDLVHAAHGDNFLPDDWRYQSIASAVEAISGGTEDSGEWADTNVDVYTGARLAWLSSNLNRVAYTDEARDEFGADGDVVDQIGMGQYVESREVFDLVYSALEARVEELEEAS